MTKMTMALAFAAGAVIGGAGMYAGISKPAQAQAMSAGTFQLVSNQSTVGADAWRLNTVTGELVHCWTGGGGGCRTEPMP